MFPVESIIPGIRASLEANRDVVLRAPPGSGKTTCVPPALLDCAFLRGKKILMLEPRRLAARSCAAYIARRLGERVGETVGFQVRLERCIGPRTRLEIVTEGLLTQRLLHDPELSDVGLVIFDEFHERSLACDIGYAMAVDVRRALRPDLRLLVMSATLSTEEIAAHLGDADVHTAEARMYPVETRYLLMESVAPISAQMAGAVKRTLPESAGDVLCFLPGEGEIKRCAEELRDLSGAVVIPLYGAMPKEEQDRVLQPLADGRRKVVLATSIAETSLTIEGVTTVIDSGLMRVSRFSPRSGMSRLETLRLTRDRADQRRGRAGRTAPGICLCLWTEAQDRTLVPAMKPEIVEADLASTVLACAEWGVPARDGLPWLTPPPAASWENAKLLLELLGALDKSGRITEHGRRMARFAAHPRLANMKELARRWDAMGARAGVRAHRCEAGEALAFAFPDRIARNRGNGTFQMTGGRGAFMERTEALATCPYLVLCDLDDRGGDAKVHLAAPIDEASIEELFADEIEEVSDTFWDKREACVKSVRRRKLGRMVLREGGQARPDADAVRRALFEGIRQKGVDQLPWTPGTRQLQARISFLNRVLGAPWPDVSDAALAAHLEDWFAPFVDGMSRWAHLERLDLAAVLDAALAEAGVNRYALDQAAPVKMEVPSAERVEHDDPLRGGGAVRAGAPAGVLRSAGDAEGRERHGADRDEAPLARATSGADHERPRVLLAHVLRARTQGPARTLSQALLAGRPADRRSHPSRAPALKDLERQRCYHRGKNEDKKNTQCIKSFICSGGYGECGSASCCGGVS